MVRKGISPVVAVVILIAIAVMVGGLVSSWISSFVTQKSQSDMCGIDTLYSLTAATANESAGEIKVRLKNVGKEDLYNFTVEADNGTVIVHLPAISPIANYMVRSGQTQYIITNFTAENITNIDTITVLTRSCREYTPKHVQVENL